jgi:hypothetical protein
MNLRRLQTMPQARKNDLTNKRRARQSKRIMIKATIYETEERVDLLIEQRLSR